jgi:hypothetical protein
MRKRIYRVGSSRSFTRVLSIVAVAVVAFTALELFFVQQSFAGIVCCTNSTFTDCRCDSSIACNISSGGKFYGTRFGTKTCWNYSKIGAGSTITSTLVCDEADNVNAPGNIIVDPLDLTSFSQNARLFCEAHGDTGFCDFEITYKREAGPLPTTVPLAVCTDNPGGSGTNDDTSTLTYEAFCEDVASGNPKERLTVDGKFTCGTAQNPGPGNLPLFCDNDPDCILNVGIAVTQGQITQQLCNDLFGAGGQVLSYSQTVKGLNCGADATDRQIIDIVGPDIQYCSGLTFDDAAVNCAADTVEPTGPTGSANAESAAQFEVTFSPTTLNINCGTNNNDTWHFTITANQHLTDLNRIHVPSLAVEGKLLVAQLGGRCDPVNEKVVPNTRTCHVSACQIDPAKTDLGTVVCNTNPKGRADLTVTGTLDTLDGLAIFGEDLNHKTTGQCRPL